MRIDGRLVWITGASSGIGRAMAFEVAGLGGRVAASARREELLTQLIGELPGEGHLALPSDVTDIDSVRTAAAELMRRAGPPDVVVANAGIGQRGTVLNTDPDVERRIMEVNFFGVTNTVRSVLPEMVDRGSGRIAVISSVRGKISTPGHATYAASKHALHGYFEALRAELYGTGVGVTMICPGYIRTEITKSALRGDGSRHDRMDRQHARAMSGADMARKAVRAIVKEKAEVFIGGPETLAPLLYKWLPGLYRALLPRVIQAP